MAKFPLYLLLLLSLLRVSDVQAGCYAGSWTNGMPVYGSLFVDGGTTIGQCQALACQIYPSISQNCPQATPVCSSTFIEKTESCQPNFSGQRRSKQETQTCNNGQTTVYPWQVYSDTCTPNPITCVYSAQTENRSCPVNFSGTQMWKRETNCPSGSYGQPSPTDWFKIQDSCTPNTPSCQVSTQTQSLSCQTGYVGTIIQIQTSTCPNPYGQPIWSGSWITTQNTCTKSVTNPTNIASPVSPVSPLNPTSVATPVSPTITSNVTAPTIQDVPNSATTLTTSQTKSTASETPTPKETPKSPFTIKTIPLALSLELFSKPMTQPNVFHDLNIGQELPNDIKMMQNIYMDLITNGSLFNPDQSDKLKRIASDAVELEQ